MHHFTFTQVLPIKLEQAWEFFSNPHNLNRITPPAMNFRIQNTLPDKVYEGMIIEYRVSPIAGISMEWITEITHVQAPHFFIDEQRKGPYDIWHHEHHFEEVTDGVKMTDQLFYSLRFGFLSKTVNQLVIQKRVLAIFDYRKQILENLFDKA